jgi:tetratricopeptide (TPR) repeat protein
MRHFTILLLALLSLSPVVASAAPPTPAAREEARAAYLRARAHYDEGRYAEAVVELKRAYSLQRISALLRYIADSYYELKKYKLALDYYRLYIKRAPFAADKAEVGLRVRELEDSLSSDEGTVATPGVRAKLPPHLVPDGSDREVPVELRPTSAPVSPPSDQPARRAALRHKILQAAKWSTLGATVVTFAVGLTYNLLARSRAQELQDLVRGGNPDLAHPSGAFSPQQYDLELTYQRYQNRSVGFLVAAGVLAAGSAVLFILDRPRREHAEPRLSVVPTLDLDRWGLSAQASFR